jgi:hypothetical protein
MIKCQMEQAGGAIQAITTKSKALDEYLIFYL